MHPRFTPSGAGGNLIFWLMLWVLVPLILVAPCMIWADQVWPGPRQIYYAPNMDFTGVGCKTADGGYALVWKEKRTNDWDTLYRNKYFFQRYNPQNQALLPEPVAVCSFYGVKTITRMIETSDNGFVFATDEVPSKLQKISSSGELLWGEGVAVPQMSNTNLLLADHQGGVYQFAWSGSPSGYWFLSHWNAAGGHVGGSFLGLNPQNTSSDNHIQVTLLPNDDLICSFVWNAGIRIVKVSSSLGVVWTQTGYPDGGSVAKIQPTRDNAGIHRVIYRTDQGGTQAWKAFVVDGDGTNLWPEPLILFSDSSSSTIAAMDAAVLSDGATLLSWFTGSTLQCVKFDLQGNLFLQGSTAALGPEPVFHTLQIRLIPASNGEAFVQITRYSNAGYVHAQAQYIDDTGFALASEAMLSFTSHPDYGDQGRSQAPLAFISGNRLCVIFELIVPGYSHLIRREITAAGVLAPPISVSSDFYRSCSQPLVSAFGANVLTACVDNDFLDVNSYDQLCIRYQIVTPQGNPVLQSWGTIPATGEYRNIDSFRIHSMEAGNALIVWSDLTEPASIRAQLINPAGEQLWDPAGRIIASSEANVALASGFASTVIGDDLYVFWTAYSGTIFQIRGQRLENGQPQWEANGRILISAADFAGEDFQYFSSARVINIVGDYLIWGRWDIVPFGQAFALKWIRVLRFDEDGGPLPGFASTGNLAFSASDPYLGLSMQQALPTSLGLLLEAGFGQWHWNGYPGEGGYIGFDTYRLQLMNPTGAAQWENGHTLASGISYYRGLLVAGDDQGYILRTDTGLKKLNYQHEAIWTNDLFTFTHRDALEVAPGYHIGLADKLKYYTFSASGDATLPPDSSLDVREQASSFCVANHNAYVLWADLSLYNVPTYTSLFLQRLRYSTSPTDDTQSPAVDRLAVHPYPNPFENGVILDMQSDRARYVAVSVYNIRGQLVREAFTGKLEAGSNMIRWDGRDSRGLKVSPGVYLCSVRGSDGALKTVKLLKF